MASKRIVTLVCDVCGTDDMVETHTISVDLTTVEGEACLTCWQSILEKFAVFAKAGRQPKPIKVSKRSEIVDFPGESWRFTAHSLVRMGERRLNPHAVAMAADQPEITHAGRDADSEVRIRGKIKVVVSPRRRVILTAGRREEATENVA